MSESPEIAYSFGTGNAPAETWTDSANVDADGDGTMDAVALDFDGDGRVDDAMWDSDDDGVADTALLDTNDDGVHDAAYADPSGRGVWDDSSAALPGEEPDEPTPPAVGQEPSIDVGDWMMNLDYGGIHPPDNQDESVDPVDPAGPGDVG